MGLYSPDHISSLFRDQSRWMKAIILGHWRISDFISALLYIDACVNRSIL